MTCSICGKEISPYEQFSGSVSFHTRCLEAYRKVAGVKSVRVFGRPSIPQDVVDKVKKLLEERK